MTTSSYRNIFRHLCGKFACQRWIPFTTASDEELWCFCALHLNKRLSKQSRRRWLETLPPSLWRYCNRASETSRGFRLTYRGRVIVLRWYWSQNMKIFIAISKMACSAHSVLIWSLGTELLLLHWFRTEKGNQLPHPRPLASRWLEYETAGRSKQVRSHGLIFVSDNYIPNNKFWDSA